MYRPIIAIVRTTFGALGLRIHVDGLDRFPMSGGAVLAMNHVSYLDFALAGRAVLPTGRLVRFMAKREIFDTPVIGWLMRGMKHIRVDRKAGASAFREAVVALQRGEVVGVFPEATISKSFELKEFKTGAARMAIDAGVPIVPMVVWGGQRIWTKNRRPDLHRRRTPISIVIGDPITCTSDESPEALTLKMRTAMNDLLNHAQSTYPDSHLGQWWAPARLGGAAPAP